MRSSVAARRAGYLPLKVCYWVLLRMGLRYLNGPKHPDEDVAKVPFDTVVERCYAELQGHI